MALENKASLSELKKQTIRVFYSWQSDLPENSNLNAIRDTLKKVAKDIGLKHPTFNVLPDEATRDTSGSPHIVQKIIEKIEKADVFIADITTITPRNAERPCPNPNVVYELGYAVCHLGWDRVVLLFNEEFGEFPKDLPFDFAQHRASPYKLAANAQKSERTRLSNLLSTAINAVIEKNPKRPAELAGLSPQKIKHQRDVENMQWLMSSIHLPTLDQHTKELPHRISDTALWFWDHLQSVVVNSLFSLYDPVLKTAVDQLHVSWRTALSHDNEYHDTPSGIAYVFTNPGDLPLEGRREKAWIEIEESSRNMIEAINTILDRLRDEYLEIDIHDTNKKAWKSYIDFKKQNDLE